MAPKKRKIPSNASSSKSRPSSSRGNPSPPENPHGIEFGCSEQEYKYGFLVNRRIIPTRYLDETTLYTLGLSDGVNWMCDRVGWTNFVQIRFPTYTSITLEFLSSLDAQILKGKDCEEGRITFRLLNKEFVLTLAQFNSIFQLPAGGERRVPNEFNASTFWSKIKGDRTSYEPSRSKATSLGNPCFRYLHRVMSHTLFGRGDSDGTVRRDELFFLWAMLEKFNVDTGSFLIRHLVKVSKAGSGSIVIGGYITAIARYLKLNLSALSAEKGNSRIDIEACLAIKMIIKENSRYYLPLGEGVSPLLLPNPTAVHPRNRANWSFPCDEENDNEESQDEPCHLFGPTPMEGTHMPGSSSFAGDNENSFAQFQLSLDQIQAEQLQQRVMIEQMQEQNRATEGRIQNMEGMVQAIYNWHLSQNHFPPPQ